jgi:hypothetical protein
MEQLERKNVGAGIPGFHEIKRWTEARASYYNGNLKAAKWIWKYRSFDLSLSLFELIMLKMPGFLFQYALSKIKEERSK